MTAQASWRFFNLGAATDADSLVPSGPGVTPSGGIATVRGDDAIRQAIVMLLATRPGERVMRPTYGCPLDRLLFNANDATTAGLAIHYVSQALRRWEPRIDIVRLDAGPAPDSLAGPSVLQIRLDYRVRSSQRRDNIIVAVDLMTEAA